MLPAGARGRLLGARTCYHSGVRLRLTLALGGALLLACTETPYSFFPIVAPPAGTGGVASGGATSGGGPSASGGVGATGGSASGGTIGQAGAPPTDDCVSVVDPVRTTIQLKAPSGLCVTAGSYAPLLGEVSYAVVMQECAGQLGQRWTLEEMEYGALVFANEAVRLNLDVRFAASDDGTPAVLFTPHRLYNQRFVQLSGEGGTFKLSPLHTPEKCLSERGVGLELWPCEPTLTDQTFEIIACDATATP